MNQGCPPEPTIRVSMMPMDTNPAGTIFGGVILGYLDQAGAIQAVLDYPGKRFVTVALREVEFHEPVFVGDVVSFYTETKRVGRTSVCVRIVVKARRYRDPEEHVTVTEAEAVYVSVGDDRRPVPLVDS